MQPCLSLAPTHLEPKGARQQWRSRRRRRLPWPHRRLLEAPPRHLLYSIKGQVQEGEVAALELWPPVKEINSSSQGRCSGKWGSAPAVGRKSPYSARNRRSGSGSGGVSSAEFWHQQPPSTAPLTTGHTLHSLSLCQQRIRLRIGAVGRRVALAAKLQGSEGDKMRRAKPAEALVCCWLCSQHTAMAPHSPLRCTDQVAGCLLWKSCWSAPASARPCRRGGKGCGS